MSGINRIKKTTSIGDSKRTRYKSKYAKRSKKKSRGQGSKRR